MVNIREASVLFLPGCFFPWFNSCNIIVDQVCANVSTILNSCYTCLANVFINLFKKLALIKFLSILQEVKVVKSEVFCFVLPTCFFPWFNSSKYYDLELILAWGYHVFIGLLINLLQVGVSWSMNICIVLKHYLPKWLRRVLSNLRLVWSSFCIRLSQTQTSYVPFWVNFGWVGAYWSEFF